MMAVEVHNFHGLFQNSDGTGLITRLDLDSKCEVELDSAVLKVKAALTPSLRLLAEKAGVEPQYRAPKYRLQGSKVYQTQNAPAHAPQQQVDVDLGVYLSASFLDTMSGNDGETIKVPAKHIAKLYFEAVDAALRKLCKVEGWAYVDGQNKKDTCCRIDLSPKGVHAHIDVPLYAMPNQEFERLAKAATLDQRGMAFEALARSDVGDQIDEEGWDQLEVVVMATRKGEWSESDVQKVIVHFKNASAAIGHPRILRRLWRYTKAWRDFTWQGGPSPSSILLMEAIVRIFEEDKNLTAELFGAGRDDRLLCHIFTRLEFYLRDDVTVHWGSEPEPLNRGADQDREVWAREATRCAQALSRGLLDPDLQPSQIVSLVTLQFGQRIPRNPDLVKAVRRAPAVALGLGTPRQQPSPQTRIRSTQGA